MSEETKEPKPELTEFNLEAAQTAYKIISSYVDHVQVSGVIIGVMASRLGEEGVKPIAQSEYWQAYMASKRQLNEAKDDIERLSRLLDKLQGSDDASAS